MKKKVTVIDYGVGNLLSIKRAFEEINAEVDISNDKKKLLIHHICSSWCRCISCSNGFN